MNDASLVRSAETACDLQGVLDRLTHRKSALSEACAQRLPFEQLRDDERRPVVLADLIDGEDVGMIERCGRLRFLFEAAKTFFVMRKGYRQDFDRDVAPERRLPRAIHFAHPASAKQRDDFVGPQPDTWRQLHVCEDDVAGR